MIRRRPRILLANEAGGGRGHVVSLREMARAFGPGADYLAVLGQVRHAEELAEVGAKVVRGPYLGFRPDRVRGRSAGSFGQFLGEVGFDDEALLARHLLWWQGTLLGNGIGLVIADYAPLVLVAVQALQAKGVPIRSVSTGNAFILPHWRHPVFPTLVEGAARPHDEAVLLGNLNRAGAGIGLPPLRALPALYRADLTLVRSLPGLDPEEHLREGPPICTLSSLLPVGGGGEEVFVYFSSPPPPAAVEALCALPLPRRGYLPGVGAETRARLAASGMVVEPRALPPEAIAQRSRMLLSFGQYGTLTRGMVLGLPQVVLPMHLEHRTLGRVLEGLGTGVALPPAGRLTAGAVLDACHAVHADTAMAARAEAHARTLRPLLAPDPRAALRARVRPLAQALGLII